MGLIHAAELLENRVGGRPGEIDLAPDAMHAEISRQQRG
jgi:hypothetical protein